MKRFKIIAALALCAPMLVVAAEPAVQSANAEMAKIDAGEFIMGSNKVDRSKKSR